MIFINFLAINSNLREGLEKDNMSVLGGEKMRENSFDSDKRISIFSPIKNKKAQKKFKQIVKKTKIFNIVKNTGSRSKLSGGTRRRKQSAYSPPKVYNQGKRNKGKAERRRYSIASRVRIK